MAIEIIVTGGTFDKEYNELNGELYFKNTHIEEMLKLGHARLRLKIHRLMLIDSLLMTPKDRRVILKACQKSASSQIVITHGTDTMVTTARFLAAHIRTKTIVLTGAMVPYRFGSSDGLFNLGSALSFAQVLPPGVYVAMNGHYFPADKVKKNKRLGIFQKL